LLSLLSHGYWKNFWRGYWEQTATLRSRHRQTLWPETLQCNECSLSYTTESETIPAFTTMQPGKTWHTLYKHPEGARHGMSLTNVSKRIWTLCLKKYVPRCQTVAITKAASTLLSNSFNVPGVAEQRWVS
jgi:hypothetical protein